MGLFGKIFEKKECSVCSGEIGLLGNRKLEDGNLCKNCAKKLSPWFSERRHSTVEEIKQQLAYRVENQTRAAQFTVTRSLGEYTKVLLDERHNWVTVTSASNLAEANPDILDFDAITGCRMDIKEDRDEVMREGKDGKKVSYNPPRYEYSYDFYMVISVRNPYFDEMRFRLNSSSVDMAPMPGGNISGNFNRTGSFNHTGNSFLRGGFNPMDYPQYRKYYNMAEEICQTLQQLRSQEPVTVSAETAAPTQSESAAPVNAGPWVCPGCGASVSGKFCEFCGTPRP